MSRTVVVVIDDMNDIGLIERQMVRLAAAEDVGFHVVSTGAAGVVINPETAPRRLRLMLLMARLADQLIPVTGEIVLDGDFANLATAVQRLAPDAVLVASPQRRLARLLRRDLLSRMRRAFAIEVRPLPIAG